MSTGYIYSIKEGFKGIVRAKFSAFVSIITIFLSLIVIGFFGTIILNANRVVNHIKERLELEIFIDNSYLDEQIENLYQKIVTIEGIESVHFISKEEAAKNFKEQFGQDVFEILDDNPLPASFQVKFSKNYRSLRKASNIIEKIKTFDGVDEVIYRQDILALFEKYFRIILGIVLGIAVLLALGSILLVSNTIKLIIFSRSHIIEIMKLVGATHRFIKRPFVIEGILQGFSGGLLAALFFYGLFRLLDVEIPGILDINPEKFLFLVVIGIFFGLIGSVSALRRFFKY